MGRQMEANGSLLAAGNDFIRVFVDWSASHIAIAAAEVYDIPVVKHTHSPATGGCYIGCAC